MMLQRFLPRRMRFAARPCLGALAMLAFATLAVSTSKPAHAQASPSQSLPGSPPSAEAVAPATSASKVSMDALMAPGALPDIVMGRQNAPVTIIEYASMTCTHCAAFHATTWPVLKARYVDTGKASFVLREFPLDPLATAGFMLARCQGPDKRNAMLDFLFDQQKSWAFVDHPVEALVALVKQTGMGQQEFETCLKNTELLNQVTQMRESAAERFKIDGTPTFFVNGTRLGGEASIAEFEKLIEPLLKN